MSQFLFGKSLSEKDFVVSSCKGFEIKQQNSDLISFFFYITGCVTLIITLTECILYYYMTYYNVGYLKMYIG